VDSGSTLDAIWSVSADERREFQGATCDTDASAATLSRLAVALGRPVAVWITHARHGHDLWDHGRDIVSGRNPGTRVELPADGRIPPAAVCQTQARPR
jgi:hypothetical protein